MCSPSVILCLTCFCSWVIDKQTKQTNSYSMRGQCDRCKIFFCFFAVIPQYLCAGNFLASIIFIQTACFSCLAWYSMEIALNVFILNMAIYDSITGMERMSISSRYWYYNFLSKDSDITYCELFQHDSILCECWRLKVRFNRNMFVLLCLFVRR